jgi:hypothetical protein
MFSVLYDGGKAIKFVAGPWGPLGYSGLASHRNDKQTTAQIRPTYEPKILHCMSLGNLHCRILVSKCVWRIVNNCLGPTRKTNQTIPNQRNITSAVMCCLFSICFCIGFVVSSLARSLCTAFLIMSCDVDHAFASVRTLFDKLAHKARMFSCEQRYQVQRLSLFTTRFLKLKWDDLLQVASGTNSPVLKTHMSDGWSTQVTSTRLIKIGNTSLQRSAKSRQEWLADKSILKTIDLHGNICSAIDIKPPKVLRGKTGWHVFEASIDGTFLPQKMTDKITMSLYLQDGAHAAMIHRTQAARHDIYFDLLGSALDADTVAQRRCMDWVFGMRCTLHCASSSIKWGISNWVTETILEDAHIVIASCRNSSEAIHNMVDYFIDAKMCFKSQADSVHLDKMYFELMGVPPQLIDALITIQPRWDMELQLLYVSIDLKRDPDYKVKVRDAILFFMTWRNWSETRWAAVGNSGRLFMLSIGVGLEHIVQLILAGKDSSNDKYHMGGFRRCTPAIKRLFAICCFATYPVERFSLALLKDDRFLRNARTLRDGMVQKARFITAIPLEIWSRLAALIGDTMYNAYHLRSDTLECVHITIAYVHHTCYTPLESLPLSLTQGDIEHNLRQLLLMADDALDCTSKNIKACTMIRFARSAQALGLLLETACSTQLVEKGHAAGAITSRDHKGLGHHQLQARAFVAEVNPLFNITNSKSTLSQLEKTWEASLNASVNVRFSARNLFCSRMAKNLSANRESRGVVCLYKTVAVASITNHNRLYDKLPAAEQDALIRLAGKVRRERASALLDYTARAHNVLQAAEDEIPITNGIT